MFKVKAKVMEKLKKEKTPLVFKEEALYKAQLDKGRVAEERALHLIVDFLSQVDDAWLGEKAGALDVRYKVDLVVETGSTVEKDENGEEVLIPGIAIGLQVKTSDGAAQKYMEKAADHKGKYGYPDVIVAGPHRSGWDVLMQLSQATELPLNRRALDAIAYAHAYKGTVQNKRCVPRPMDLINLGLARLHPGGLLFGASPPPMP